MKRINIKRLNLPPNKKLEIVQSERVASAGGRKGDLGGIPPALQILGEISSNFFERTPPVRKCLCWLALCEGYGGKNRKRFGY
ncbi:MAG: hypothetical protein ABFD00_07720 [Chloroherpetonaceae bacterium]